MEDSLRQNAYANKEASFQLRKSVGLPVSLVPAIREVNAPVLPGAVVFAQGGLAPWQKRRVMELLETRLEQRLHLSMLAGECRLSVSHFARSFKKTYGTPVHRFVILRRVERAKKMLAESSRALPEIALLTGFSDQAAFCRTFGSVVGTTPGRFRREIVQRRQRDFIAGAVTLARMPAQAAAQPTRTYLSQGGDDRAAPVYS